MLNILKALQLFLSVFIVFVVVIQTKTGGLSSSISGAVSAYRSKRGLERLILILTIVSAFILVVNSLAIVILS